MGDLEPRAVAQVDRVPAAEHARDDPVALWCELDDAWQEAFRQAWEALRTGNIAVGACVSRTDGTLVAASRNRVCDTEGPPGETFGSSVAHAELNTLARLRFRAPRDLVLTSTLQPCLQCHAAIRMAPIAAVRFAGADPVWDGCGDFTTLAPWVARHHPVPTQGPRTDEIGTFAVLLARSGPGHKRTLEEALRRQGLGDILDLAYRLEETGNLAALKAMNVRNAFEYLWPELRTLTVL
jgi:tRNA(Arg) A34 adenosine deaminase TadA